MMSFEQSGEFQKEIKKLSKKYRNLDKDLDKLLVAIKTEALNFDGLAAAILHRQGEVVVIKARLFSRYLRQDSLRVIYIQNGSKVLLIEMYHKNQKAREDKDRIKRYMSDIL